MKRSAATWIVLAAYVVLVVAASIAGVPAGIRTGESSLSFLREMVIVLPPAFILIGLFEAWVPRETVERHLGVDAGIVADFWALLLAGTTVGGLYVAFPVACSLRAKGARLGVAFAYIGLAGICRVPMTLFEISFLGAKFTLIRYLVGVPLVILLSEALGRALDRRGFELVDPGDTASM